MANKKPVFVSNHPATTFLNFCYHNNIKQLLPDVENIYEKLEDLHIKGKNERSPLSYLTTQEILNFMYLNRKNSLHAFAGLQREIFNTAHLFSVALGWKQYQQIYKFHPALLEELQNIDITDDKFATISREEIQFLPCYNFFVEYDFETNGTKYVGFFVYFDKINKTDQEHQIHILFITDFHGIPTNPHNGYPTYVDYYNLTLLYSYSDVTVHEESTGKTYSFEVEPKEVLRIFNPITFQQLGEEGAMKLITEITQIITYLCATNCDMQVSKRPTKRPDIKRTRVTDAEYEKWDIGKTLYNNRKVEKRFVDTVDGAYERELVNPKEESTREVSESYRRKTGYHMRPHMRRAHWQYYWYGKKDGSEERVKRRKYVPAVFVNNTEEEVLTPTREIVKYRF